ncbi:MAG: S9 family peptidase [Planctomycetota bacterium]
MPDTSLISRTTLFGNPFRSNVQISPDGKRISLLSEDEGVLNVWVASVDDIENPKVVTNDRRTGIHSYFWAFTNNHILFLQDNDGDENFHLYAVELSTSKVLDLTPVDGISAQMIHKSHRVPDEILVGINDRDQHWFHDVYRVNLLTGQREIVEENNGYIGFLADDDLQLRLAITMSPSSDMVLMKRDQAAADWQSLLEIPAAEILTTAPIKFDKSGQNLYLLDSRGQDKAGVSLLDLATRKSKHLFSSDKADVDSLLSHPTENTLQAITYTYDRVRHEILDDDLQVDFEKLHSICDGELEISSQTLSQSHWIASYLTDDGPVKYYLYDRAEKTATYLFSNRPEIENLHLAKMQTNFIHSRDGLELVSYLTLPKEYGEQPESPLPTVLLVHGGPWHRDHWGYNPIHQLLANRGYAVISVNFRGSTGFGKSFINAANGEWAGRMHDDLVDTVRWAVDHKISDPEKVAIMGGSYGGYSALVGLTFTPELFACGIDIVGPSNLITLLENPPPYWMPILPMMTTRVGDHTTDEGREFLKSRSPLFKVDQIRRPLLIGQGANDQRVKQSESDQIVEAMKQKEIPVTYVLYPEEGHGFDRPENDISFYAICEAFLAEHLGGTAQPVGKDFEGAKFEVLAGAELVEQYKNQLA